MEQRLSAPNAPDFGVTPAQEVYVLWGGAAITFPPPSVTGQLLFNDAANSGLLALLEDI